jgi:molybdopterin molybdotransferase
MSLLSLEDALAILLREAQAEPSLPTETCTLQASLGRVLAEPFLATQDLPAWDNSAMDGYAVALADLALGALPITQTVFAGHAAQPLAAGSCARIFTGAMLPPGADTVVMQEQVNLNAQGHAAFKGAPQLGEHVRKRGQEALAGQLMLDAGTRIGPLQQGLLASFGQQRLSVRAPLRVAVLSCGDELVEPGQALAAGQIYNSNRSLLLGLLTALGCEVLDAGVLSDDLQQCRRHLQQLPPVDLILSSAGVSVGDADCLGQLLRESAEVLLWKLALKPGKPLMFARYQGTPLLALPGNPASALVTFCLLVRPYCLARMGAQVKPPLRLQLPAAFDWPQAGSRREFLRVRLIDGQLHCHPQQSSGVLASAVWADGLLEVAEGRCFKRGELLPFLPFADLLY